MDFFGARESWISCESASSHPQSLSVLIVAHVSTVVCSCSVRYLLQRPFIVDGCNAYCCQRVEAQRNSTHCTDHFNFYSVLAEDM